MRSTKRAAVAWALGVLAADAPPLPPRDLPSGAALPRYRAAFTDAEGRRIEPRDFARELAVASPPKPVSIM